MGLVARSYWISHDQALAANTDDGIPLSKAKVIGPDSDDLEVELAPALAAEPDLRTLRVVWVRNPGDASGMAEAMGRAEASIRRLIPQYGLEPTFSELLVPQTLRDLAIPMPPPDWQQFVVEPMDRPNPSASDSFWDRRTPPRQGLHAALMIGGVLGGSNLEQPAPREAKTDAPWVVHPFTRAIRGADRARRETRAVLRERLSTISAADVAPDQFFRPEAPEDSEYVEDATNWLLSRDDEALRFRRPKISFERRGQSFMEFLWEVLRFIGWALRGMFGPQRWKDLFLTIRARIARRLEADDYGATIDAGAPTPKGLDLIDWDAKEAEAQGAAKPRIVATARADGRVPDKSLWRDLVSLVPSLIDGSAPPYQWSPRKRFDHTYVLPAQAVVRTESKLLDAASSGAGTAVEDELRGVKRIGGQELARARQLARLGLGSDLATFASPSGRVTLTAQAIAEHAQNEAREQREEFASSLGRGGAVEPADIPLLGRLRASVVSDLLLARLSAEQLAAMTKTAVPNTLPKLQKMLRDATWVVLGAAVIGAALVAFLVRFAQEIGAFFAAAQLPYPTDWMQIVWWIFGLVVGVLVFVFARLFYVYHAYNEVGRRRLEYVQRRADAAVAAYEERNRLRNAERILAGWEDILSSIGTRDEKPTAPLASVPSDLPDALQVAEPAIDDAEIARMVVEDAIEPGWFGDAFDALVADVLDKDNQERLWSDPGMPAGPLARLRENAIEGAFQRAWWDAWGARAANKIVKKLSIETTHVRPLVARRQDTLTAKEFHAEITREMKPEYRPGSDYQELFDASEEGRRDTARARQGTERFLLTPAMTAVDTVLVYRRLGRITRIEDDLTSEADDHEIGSA
ncbi:MAG: hypothetical protein IJO71_08295 [Microbacterium sp.]|uniref:hypothetical protein n=1 Tax=Microbacterium sp. TaxID=51671 RepID=UPI0025EEB026|nr:hypothetical protein [Microbacterium sp.]MBQ9917185.1 hypothetical protein [Microbacterium sp.]